MTVRELIEKLQMLDPDDIITLEFEEEETGWGSYDIAVYVEGPIITKSTETIQGIVRNKPYIQVFQPL